MGRRGPSSGGRALGVRSGRGGRDGGDGRRARSRGRFVSRAARRARIGRVRGRGSDAKRSGCAAAPRLIDGRQVSRLLCDVNRPVGSPTMFRDLADGEPVRVNADLGETEALKRTETYWLGYHRELGRVADAVDPRLIASVHSYTDCYEGSKRDFHVGVLCTADVAEAQYLTYALRAAGFSCEFEQPWAGRDGFMCVRRAELSLMTRGDAAAAAWIFRGDESSRLPRGYSVETSRRGCRVDIPWRRVAAAATWISGYSVWRRIVAGRDVDVRPRLRRPARASGTLPTRSPSRRRRAAARRSCSRCGTTSWSTPRGAGISSPPWRPR